MNILNKNDSKFYLILKIIIVTVFAFTLFLDSILVFSGNIFDKVNQIYFEKVKPINIMFFLLAWIITFFIITIIEKSVDKLEEKVYKKSKKNKSSILFYFIFLIILLICWLPYILSYFPGGIYSDTGSTINQALGIKRLNNHHPILYAFIFKIFFMIGDAFQGGTQLEVELFSIFQVVLMAMVCAYFIYWLYKKDISKKYIILTILFFGICRLIPIYAISLWKDVPFCLALFMYIIFVADIVYYDGKNLEKVWPVIYYNILLILVSFLRNNGKYITFATTIVILIIYRKNILKHLKKFAIISIFSIIMTFVIQGPVYNKLEMNTEYIENVSILFQQVFAVVAKDGEITDEQREFINAVCPIEVIKENYSPCIIDNVKWSGKFNNDFLLANKNKFFKVWLEIGMKHPKIYIEEYLLNTIGFWDINRATMDAYINPTMWGDTDTFIGIKQKDYIQNVTGKTIRNILRPTVPVSSAIYLFILIFGALLTVYRKKYKNLLIYLPAFLVWGTIMIAAPIAFSLRYVYILVLTIPLNLIVPLINTQNEKSSNEGILKK